MFQPQVHLPEAPLNHVPIGLLPLAGLSRRVMHDAEVLEASGMLSDLVEELDLAIQLALGHGPRGVVCDLSNVLGLDDPNAIEVLATAGRHARDWPGMPVAAAIPDPLIRAALAVHPLGRHLILTPSTTSALSAVLATPTPVVERLLLAPHPTAPRTARDFLTKTLLSWALGPFVLSASLVISELVANATMDATTDIELSVAWNMGALRVTVRDNGPDLSRKPYSHFDPHGQRMSVVAVLSRALGILPTDDGKVVWAVLDAVQPRRSTHRVNSQHATAPLVTQPSS